MTTTLSWEIVHKKFCTIKDQDLNFTLLKVQVKDGKDHLASKIDFQYANDFFLYLAHKNKNLFSKKKKNVLVTTSTEYARFLSQFR